MHILHCISGLGRASGGPSFAIPAFCDAIARLGHDVTLLAGTYDDNQELVHVPETVRLVLHPASRRFRGRSPAMTAWLRSNAHRADVVHVHGLWEQPAHYAAAAAARLGKPCVMAPIGMLEPEALQRRWLLKKLLWNLSENRWVSGAACFQATSPFEVNNIRRLVPHAEVCYVPNGVEIPPISPTSPPRDDYLLFLGRVHPHKNVSLLLDAWKVARRPSNWRLVIAGPLDGEYGKQIQTMASEIGPSVEVLGPVWGDQKWNLLRRARALILPSKSENFGMVVAEALACETPAIVTRGAPWADLEKHDCGWWVEPEHERLVAAIQAMLALSEDELATMGRNGRQLVEQHYTWDRMGAQMVNVYQWLLDGGSPPECVVS